MGHHAFEGHECIAVLEPQESWDAGAYRNLNPGERRRSLIGIPQSNQQVER